jgi:hypothetical protein
LEAPAEGELGSITLEGPQLGELTSRFRDRVEALGGRVAVIDRVTARFTQRAENEQYTYDCGMPKAPRRCIGQRTRRQEVMILELTGRAFR